MTTKFSQIPIGARFEFRGHRYEKLALSLARDEERLGNIFHAETEVVPEAAPRSRPCPGGTHDNSPVPQGRDRVEGA